MYVLYLLYITQFVVLVFNATIAMNILYTTYLCNISTKHSLLCMYCIYSSLLSVLCWYLMPLIQYRYYTQMACVLYTRNIPCLPLKRMIFQLLLWDIIYYIYLFIYVGLSIRVLTICTVTFNNNFKFILYLELNNTTAQWQTCVTLTP